MRDRANQAACGCEASEKGRKALGVDAGLRAENRRRLSRIEGQVRGLARMVDDDRYCADILVQLSSVVEALRAVGKNLMRNHLRHCASEMIRKGSAREVEGMYEELLDLMYRHSR
jgi:CsoR family transcriptional regulator, copper-sensing transcriptional repressor